MKELEPLRPLAPPACGPSCGAPAGPACDLGTKPADDGPC